MIDGKILNPFLLPQNVKGVYKWFTTGGDNSMKKKTTVKSTTKPTTKTTSKSKRSKKKISFTPEAIEELIKQKAFEIYSKRGQGPGDPMGDWINAEKQVKKELRLSQ